MLYLPDMNLSFKFCVVSIPELSTFKIVQFLQRLQVFHDVIVSCGRCLPTFQRTQCCHHTSTLQMETACSSEITVHIYQTTLCHTSEDNNLHSHHCENLKSHFYSLCLYNHQPRNERTISKWHCSTTILAMSTVLVCPCARLRCHVHTETRCTQVRIKTVHSSVIKAPIKHRMVKEQYVVQEQWCHRIERNCDLPTTPYQNHGSGHIWSAPTPWWVCWSPHLYCGHPTLHFLFGSYVQIFFGICLPFVAYDISTVIWSL
jgi:hypothetical protein